MINKLSIWIILFSSVLIGFLLIDAKAIFASPPANFQSTQIIGSGLDVVSGFDFAPDGRIFLLERTGDIRIYKNGNLLSTPFTHLNTAATGDRGLIGIAFDPDYVNNHYVYFYYTGSDTLNHLVRMDATPDIASLPPVAIYETSTASLELHVGGTIRFGPDGKLYLSVGDNGNASNAQDLTVPFGKILRLNKDGSIPADNPFVGQSGKLPEIWAYGFRNPFRFQFDQSTSRLFLGDVGDYSWEEVNIVNKGGNYGWPTCEGSCANPNFINPIYAYPHNNESAAIAGGFVYRGNMFPTSYLGKYFFADYAQGFIKYLTLDSDGNSLGVTNFDSDAGSVVELKMAADGSIYFVTYVPARLYRITHSSFNQFPTARSAVDQTSGNPGLTVNFSSSGSFDPEGTALTYNWDFGDTTTSTQASPSKTYNNKGRYTIQLTVSDGVNVAQASPLVIQVGTPPTVNIDSPSSGLMYKAGDSITYSGSGTDANGAPLAASSFTVNVIFHHDTHIHPVVGPVQSQSGQFTIPSFGEASANTSYEIIITGTDADGLQTDSSVTIFPQKVDLTFLSSPTGLQILLDGSPTDTPVTLQHVVGFQRTLSAPVIQDLNGNTYSFSSWSDGVGIIHQITAPIGPATYTANFTLLPSFNASFFNNTTLTGTPALTRADKKIDFDWGASPYPGVNADNFSVRWTNSVQFSSARYRFITTTDDGVRLYIDNQLVIDKWINQSATTYYADVNLTSGSHLIKMEYFEGSGDAVAHLTWDLSPTQASPGPTPTPIISTTPTASVTPQVFLGYKGEYWNAGTGSNPTIPASAPNLTRDDSVINFNWGLTSPSPTINADHFVTRWTKTTNFSAGNYNFTTTSDDGIRVFVDNQILIDKWVDQSATTYSANKILTAGNHIIRVEYYENGYDAIAKFSFAQAAGPTSTPIPATPTPTTVVTAQGLTGEYFDNINLTSSKLIRTDPTINFNWANGSPNAVLGPDTFSVRWTGFVQPQFSQTYTFYTNTDDGVRLWINNQLIVDKWINQSPREWTGTISLVANQRYSIRMEYFENTGGSVAKLSWSSPSQVKQIIPQSRLTP